MNRRTFFQAMAGVAVGGPVVAHMASQGEYPPDLAHVTSVEVRISDEAIAEIDRLLYWDSKTNKVTTVPTGNTPFGVIVG